MRFLSDDGKVFNTEQECLRYENSEKKRSEEERLKREHRERMDEIKKTYEELQKLISDFYSDYGVKRELHISPVYDFMDMLFG